MPKYDLIEEEYHYDTITAPDLAAALKVAVNAVDAADYADTDGPCARTIWVDVVVINCADRDDCGRASVTLDPAAPDCSSHEHAWQSPLSVVGGVGENPGVHGHGGGVIITEVCRNCGIYRETNTWAQRSETGEQGLYWVGYREADDASISWSGT